MVTAELAHQSANLGRLTRVTLTHCVTTHFLFSGKKRKEKNHWEEKKIGKENGSWVKERGPWVSDSSDVLTSQRGKKKKKESYFKIYQGQLWKNICPIIINLTFEDSELKKKNIPEHSTRFLGFCHTKFGFFPKKKSTILKISTFFQVISVEPAKVLGYWEKKKKRKRKEKGVTTMEEKSPKFQILVKMIFFK
jgi:hypothetical protein